MSRIENESQNQVSGIRYVVEDSSGPITAVFHYYMRSDYADRMEETYESCQSTIMSVAMSKLGRGLKAGWGFK